MIYRLFGAVKKKKGRVLSTARRFSPAIEEGPDP
jgi:hypothetical protein